MSELKTGQPVLPEVKNCEYTAKTDYDMILKKVDELDGGQETFNAFVWCTVELSFGRCSRVKDLPREAIEKLRHLEMDGRWWQEKTLEGLDVSNGLGKLSQLQHLVMGFDHTKLTDLA